jgi:predicted GNAT family acetyltransferase
MCQVMAEILGAGAVPVLHVFLANAPAIRVYQALGFKHRRSLHLAVLKPV